jgi:hypothetical protein
MRRVGRNRETHKRLPKGWTPSPSGTIYFRPTNEQDRQIVKSITGGPLSLRLGKTHDEAAATYARDIVAARRRVSVTERFETGTVGEIVARAKLEFLPTISHPKTATERERHIDALEKKFGTKRYARNVFEASRDTAGVFLRAMDIQRHIFEGRKTRRVAVNREVRTWELVFTWARAPWGLTEYNPCSGLMENEETHRKVVPTDEGIFRLYRHLVDPPARFMVAAIRYYGRRKVELLGLKLTDVLREMPDKLREDGIHFRRGKDADSKEIIVRWDSRLRRMIARVLRWRDQVIRPIKDKEGKGRSAPKVVSTALLLNRRGGSYTESGFNSARKRAMLRSGLATFVGEEVIDGKKRKRYQSSFTFHDMRKSRAQTLPREKAVDVLAHDDPRTTNRVYRPGAIIVDLNDEVNSRKTSGNSRKNSGERR